MKFSILIAAICLINVSGIHAQVKTPVIPDDKARYPYWIKMMQDTEANYWSTVIEFEKYWNICISRSTRLPGSFINAYNTITA
jgi:hypothetical protein